MIGAAAEEEEAGAVIGVESGISQVLCALHDSGSGSLTILYKSTRMSLVVSILKNLCTSQSSFAIVMRILCATYRNSIGTDFIIVWIHVDETKGTLFFASRANRVRANRVTNCAQVNEVRHGLHASIT